MKIIYRKVTLFKRLNLSGIGHEHSADLFTIVGTKKYKPEITELRAKIGDLSNKDIQVLKLAQLPAFTGCCACTGGHGRHNITSLSGYIILDLDGIQNIHKTKKMLTSLPFVAGVSVSCSGRGLFVVVQIADPSNHFLGHWIALNTYFQSIGLTLDRQCKDITRLRYISYDPDVFINEKAEIWDRIEYPQVFSPPKIIIKDSHKGLDKAIDHILRDRIDITTGRDNWLLLGSVLNNYYPNAEDMFVSISQFHEDFSERECRETFRRYCSKQWRDKGVLFNILKNHNINIKSL